VSPLAWLLLPPALLAAVGLGASFYLTKRQPRTLFATPAEFGLEFEEVVFPAADGLALQGCWVPAAGSDRAVVILHGHGGSLDWDVQRAPFFNQAGYNVFLFDFRAHARSRGWLATFGYLERNDVLGAVSFLKSRGMRRIGLLGFSYGGIAAMLAAPGCPDIHAVVSDGGPARVRSAIAGRLVEAGLPPWFGTVLAWLTISATSIRLGTNLLRYEPVRRVGGIAPCPALFIHGELDRYLPDFDELFAAAGEPKEAWRLPGVEHTKASEAHPEAYYRRVVGFVDRYL